MGFADALKQTQAVYTWHTDVRDQNVGQGMRRHVIQAFLSVGSTEDDFECWMAADDFGDTSADLRFILGDNDGEGLVHLILPPNRVTFNPSSFVKISNLISLQQNNLRRVMELSRPSPP